MKRTAMKLIFRDDDPSYFTTPALLEAIYRPVWERGWPVCLSVIPAHYGRIYVPWEPRGLDPNVPPGYRGRAQHYPVSENRELCAWLDDLVRQGLVEITLHGYSHVFYEFGTYDVPVLRDKLAVGRAELERAFPHAEIGSFIAPYNALTESSLEVILEAGLNLHLDRPDLPGRGPHAAVPLNQVVSAGRAALIVSETSDYGFNQPDGVREARFARWFALRDRCAAETSSLLIACHHYYMFYADFQRPKPREFNLWHAFLARVGSPTVTTFNRACAL